MTTAIEAAVRKHFVLGFAFNANKSRIVLIEKNRPDYQAGLLNGIGGKIEEAQGEDVLTAMCREFEEETGVISQPGDWHHTGEINGDFGTVQVYWAADDKFMQAQTRTDEQVMILDMNMDDLRPRSLSTVPMLIEAALDQNANDLLVQVTYRKNPYKNDLKQD